MSHRKSTCGQEEAILASFILAMILRRCSILTFLIKHLTTRTLFYNGSETSLDQDPVNARLLTEVFDALIENFSGPSLECGRMLDRYFANREEKSDVTKIQICECGIGRHFYKERDEKDPLAKNQHVSANWPVREISQVISLYLSLKKRRAKHNGGQ